MTGKHLSHIINVRTLPKRGLTAKLSPDREERGIIASTNQLDDVLSFEAECLVKPWGKKGVEIGGRVQALVVQPCALSGDPLEARVDELIKATYLPETSDLRKPDNVTDGEIVLDYDGEDAPEYFSGDEINLYDVVLEFFVLGLNPFLRRDDAEALSEANDAASREDSPFAVLKSLKNN